MPARQPFTTLCRAASSLRSTGRADLHIHTTFSDGTYTPAEVVDLARRSGLHALAITDHDTVAAMPSAQVAAVAAGIELIPGIEITAEHEEKEIHVLGYFIRPDEPALRAALQGLHDHRAGRFWDMVERLRHCGVGVKEEEIRPHVGAGVLGRRNLAELLVRLRRVGSVREAFARYLRDGGRIALPKLRLPAAEALALVRNAGGVASWAHPSYDCNRAWLAELRALGLGALEIEYPSLRTARKRELRAWAAELGLAVTGGSDCHGPDQPSRAIGANTITAQELEVLRQQSMSRGH